MKENDLTISRKVLYIAMLVLLVAIFIGAGRGASPIYLAVGFIGEIILVSTVHLSSVIQRHGCGMVDHSHSPRRPGCA